MRILSKFKDYYDFVGQQYGGGDPKVTYSRSPINTEVNEHGFVGALSIVVPSKEMPNIDVSPFKYRRGIDIYTKVLVVANYSYLLISKRLDPSHLNLSHGPYHVLDLDTAKELSATPVSFLNSFVRVESSKWAAISRKVGHPVYEVTGLSYDPKRSNYTITVDSQCPVLSKLGIPSIVKPEIMYQDISYFLANLMHESPDLAPPVVLADKDRIVQHGFDLRQSFRHRMPRSEKNT